jgi:hypothetical protein
MQPDMPSQKPDPLLLGIRRRMDSNCAGRWTGRRISSATIGEWYFLVSGTHGNEKAEGTGRRHGTAGPCLPQSTMTSPTAEVDGAVRRGFHSDALDLTSIKFGIRNSDRGQGSQDFRADEDCGERLEWVFPSSRPSHASQLPPRRTRARAPAPSKSTSTSTSTEH